MAYKIVIYFLFNLLSLIARVFSSRRNIEIVKLKTITNTKIVELFNTPTQSLKKRYTNPKNKL